MGIVGLAEGHFIVLPVLRSLLIIELGKDDLEDLVELVDAGVRQDEFLKVLNDALEIELPF